MPRPKSQQSITGRDGYIVGKALAYAVAHIQSLPEDRQEFSDMLDMCSIAIARTMPFLPAHVSSVLTHTGIKVDLWPSSKLHGDHPPLSRPELFLRKSIDQHLSDLERILGLEKTGMAH